MACLWHTGGHPPNISPRSWYSPVDPIQRTMPGSHHSRYRFNPSGTRFKLSSISALVSFYYLPDSSGTYDIKLLLGEVENFSGTVPVRDMRTVSDAPVPGVTSLRLLRQHLWCRTGSPLPFWIRAASLWHFVFRACIFVPRGGPRTEPPRPSGCQPTTSSSYLRGVRFLLLPFSAFTTPSRTQSS